LGDALSTNTTLRYLKMTECGHFDPKSLQRVGQGGFSAASIDRFIERLKANFSLIELELESLSSAQQEAINAKLLHNKLKPYVDPVAQSLLPVVSMLNAKRTAEPAGQDEPPAKRLKEDV